VGQEDALVVAATTLQARNAAVARYVHVYCGGGATPRTAPEEGLDTRGSMSPVVGMLVEEVLLYCGVAVAEGWRGGEGGSCVYMPC